MKLKTQNLILCLFIAPPPRPEQFRSREELKRYLQLVSLEYLMINT